MFEITIKKSFFAAHYLKKPKGGTEMPHDHHWVIEAKFRSETVEDIGFNIDFRKVDHIFQEIFHVYQGKTLNEFEPFTKISPSAENLAKHIYEKLSDALRNEKVGLASVTAWEDPEHGATYTPS